MNSPNIDKIAEKWALIGIDNDEKASIKNRIKSAILEATEELDIRNMKSDIYAMSKRELEMELEFYERLIKELKRLIRKKTK